VIGTPWSTPELPLVRTGKAESGSNKVRGDDKSCAGTGFVVYCA
jgi:hypothetical protein